MKVPLTKIYENLDFATDRLSTQIRTLTFGILALVWLFLSGSKDVPALQLGSKRQLLGVALLCVLTLFIDVVQYWSSYMSSNDVRKTTEERNEKEAAYDETSILRRLQRGCFWVKQVTALLATVWFLWLMVRTIGTA